MKRGPKVERTRASGLWTEARFWQFLRSALRSASQRWPPRIYAKQSRRRKYEGDNARQKWEYRCDKCRRWFPDKRVEMDHLEPCGSIRSFEDLAEFARRLYCEADGFRLLCIGCHNTTTHAKGRPTPKPIRKLPRQ